MMKGRQFLLGILFLFLLSASEVRTASLQMQSAVVHKQISGLAHGLFAVLDHADTLEKFDSSRLPRDAQGRILFAHPGENGEWQDSQADLMHPDNQAKVMEFLQSEEWTSARQSSPNIFQRTGAWFSNSWKAMGDKWDAVTGKDVREAAGNLNASNSRLSTVSLGDVIGAVAFGLINGMLMGMADMFRDSIRAINSDPTCQPPMQFIKESFKRALNEGSAFVKGIFNKSEREGASFGEFFRMQGKFFLQCVGDVFLGLKDMCQLCDALRKVFGSIFLMILIGVIVTIVVLLFPGVGIIVKIITSFLTLIFGIAFLVKTAKKFIKSLGDRSRQGTINLIESTCEFIGFLIAVFILTGSNKGKEDPKMKERYENNDLAKKSNSKYTPETTKDLDNLENTVKASKEGRAGAVKADVASLKGDSVTFDKSVGRWRDAQGRFAKAPAEARGLKWDANVQRWRDVDTGRFAKAPTPGAGAIAATESTVSSTAVTFDKSVGRWRAPNGQFAKPPASANGLKWDANVQRWREIDTGRFAKAPVGAATAEVKTAGNIAADITKPVVKPTTPTADIYWDGRPQVMRWRERATGRFHVGPAPPPPSGPGGLLAPTIIRGVVAVRDGDKPAVETPKPAVETQKPQEPQPPQAPQEPQAPQRPQEPKEPQVPVAPPQPSNKKEDQQQRDQDQQDPVVPVPVPAPRSNKAQPKAKTAKGKTQQEVVRRFDDFDGDQQSQDQQSQDQQIRN